MSMYRTFSALTVALAATCLMGQETTGTVVGHITDHAGKPLAGVRVRINGAKLLGERIATTDAKGQFRIPLLPNGDYSALADHPQYVGKKGSFSILAGQTSRFDATMKPLAEMKEATAVVEIVSSNTQVDKTETVTQSNVSLQNLDKIVAPDMGNMGFLAAGLSTPDLNTQDALKVRGGTGHSTKILLNGVTQTEEGGGYRLGSGTIVDMIESMAVIQSPLNARYGNTDGGIITMVTTKGSNTFGGSIRAKFNRSFWGANGTEYANRLGKSNDFQPGGDDASKSYEVTFKGPIWKDRITFAYGGTLTPTYYYQGRLQRLVGDPAQSSDTSGIFYRDQANGNVIRRSNLWQQNAPVTDVAKDTFNQFVVFGQITPEHSLEWSYNQSASDYVSNYGVIDGDKTGNDAYTQRQWNMGYKGILSASGVLEARFARTTRAFPHPYSPSNPPVFVGVYPTYTQDENGHYFADNLLDGYLNGTSVNTNGFVTDRGDTLVGESGMLNYQHVVDAAGSHLLDFGMQHEKFEWDTQASGARYQFSVPGQISPFLTAADIEGSGPKDPSVYAGKYLVFNYQAHLRDLDPNRPVDAGANDPILGSQYEGLVPQVRVLNGSESGKYSMTTTSYYVNDLWTLSDRHSLMVGIRYDQLKVKDAVKTIASYGLPTLRAEYKLDLFGDQTRLVNVSFGQFHSRQPGSLFYPMVMGRLADSTTYYWNQGTATPYLVTKAQLLDLANYGKNMGTSYGGESFVVAKDWKAPVSNEITVGFRRQYSNGANWRATFIHKSWKNLFDYFPGEVYTTRAGEADFRSVLANDGSLKREYNGVELEWMLPLTKKLTFGGNYTFARLMTDGRNLIDNPSRSQSHGGNSSNFRFWYANFFDRSTFAPVRLQDPEHVLNWYASYDLTEGKVKSSLALRGYYRSGNPEGRSRSYTIGYPTMPGYYEPSNPAVQNTNGLYNYASQTMQAGQYFNQDSYDMHLRYTLEMPIVRSLTWFLSMDVNNVFNHRTLGTWGVGGPSRDKFGTSTNNPYGWQAGLDQSNPFGSYRRGARTMNFETGFRF